MHIILSYPLWALSNNYPHYGKILKAWMDRVRRADWFNAQDVVATCPKTSIQNENATFMISENSSTVSVRIHYQAKIVLIEQIQFYKGSRLKTIQSAIPYLSAPKRQISYIWNNIDYKDVKHALLFGWLNKTSSVEDLETLAELMENYEQRKWNLHPSSFCDDLKFFMWQTEKNLEDLSILLGSKPDADRILNDKHPFKISSLWRISKNWDLPFFKTDLLHQIVGKSFHF